MDCNIGFLFDLDGVIIDTESRYTEIWHEINTIFPTGVNGMEQKIKGTTLPSILNTYFPDKDIQKKVVKILNDRENSMIYDFCPNALPFLLNIKNSGYKTALFTSSNQRKMNHLFAQHPELKDFFHTIIDGSRVSESKPSPEGYLKAAEIIGVNPHRCAVFEDSLQGIRAGRAAGAFVVAVEGTIPSDILRPEADILVSDLSFVNFSHLCEILKSR